MPKSIIADLKQIGRTIAPPGRKFIFQQDMAPAHNAATTRAYLERQRIPPLPRPGNSPDLNIIENVWAIAANKMQAHRSLPRNANDLWERVQQAWRAITVEEVRALFRSIPARITETLKAKGGSTHY